DKIPVGADNALRIAPALLRHAMTTTHPGVAQVLLERASVAAASDVVIPQLATFIYRVPKAYFAPESSIEEREFYAARVRMFTGSMLGRLVCPEWADLYYTLAKDADLGADRFNIILNLEKTKRNDTGEVLLRALDDDTVRNFAAQALGALRYSPARERLESLSRNRDPDLRRAAHSALMQM
ncbi:HEAT repeat domain-containing protein, partial [Streptomyces cinereoruber]|uniref:HEAT repeat domain-containing protein n=1 Tax=Streptomyces cinereoruber TaxID=67260 RepID=UPI00362C0A3C